MAFDGAQAPLEAAVVAGHGTGPVRPPGRFLFIDSLRGLAALSVVLYHVREGHHIDALCDAMPSFLSALLRHGHVGVELFFVLSGFVIAHSMWKSDVTARYIGRFMLRRSIRLDPPYWASMVLGVGVGVLSTHLVAGKAYAVPGAARVLAHLFYLQDLLGMASINAIYWTLCIEIQFYATFALLMLMATRLRRHVSADRAFYAVMVPATALADLSPLGLRWLEAPGLFVASWHLFIAGVLVWWAGVARPRDRAAAALAGAELLLLAVVALTRADAALGVGVGAAAVILAAARLGKLATWLSARPLQVLGALSYSLYLVHNPVTGAAFRAGYRVTGRSAVLEAMWTPVVLSVCLAFAYAFHRLIERPSLALSRKVRLAADTPRVLDRK